jgi:hypothetical protein
LRTVALIAVTRSAAPEPSTDLYATARWWGNAGSAHGRRRARGRRGADVVAIKLRRPAALEFDDDRTVIRDLLGITRTAILPLAAVGRAGAAGRRVGR